LRHEIKSLIGEDIKQREQIRRRSVHATILPLHQNILPHHPNQEPQSVINHFINNI
jgi:hypothetical protein